MTLTAVEEFSKLHDDHELPANERYYRDLLPQATPQPGEQYAFEVDLDACTGCKACVTACHSLNGLDGDESWRSVGLIQSAKAVAFQQTVTTACHHCVDPACLAGCPVDAYEKDPVTGIVSHLDDQCIGCSYCTLTCPYEVPRFNKQRGIVRKCDMCRGRLAASEAPACVQACPNGAIRISIVSQDAARTNAARGALVPGAPPSTLTVPTTTYRTARELPADARAADKFSLHPAHAHLPLSVMLVLTQLAVGAIAGDVALRWWASDTLEVALRPANAAVGAGAGLVALLASTLHLGRPWYAFRAVLGVTHSWLSREIVAFSVFALLAPLYAVRLQPAAGLAAVAAGAAGIVCSVMLYAFTGRTWWRARRSAVTFTLSALATGLATTAASIALVTWYDPTASRLTLPVFRILCVGVAAVLGVKLARDAAVFLHLRDRSDTDDRRSAMLLRNQLWNAVQARYLLGVVGGVAVPLVLSRSASAEAAPTVAMLSVVTLAAVVGAELIERRHFFEVAVAPRMPGELH